MEYRFHRDIAPVFWSDISRICSISVSHLEHLFFLTIFVSFLFLLRMCVQLGMNTKDYKYKWGGEDWDLLDRVLMASLEVERNKYPGLYHHYQPPKKWN